jgi:GNAT superfamily N-acetyltransferase
MVIRHGKKDDLPQVLDLIKELAEYERALHEVTNTVARLEADGFGPQPLYGLFVADSRPRIVGLSLFYWRYSTWKGKRLYLEDIVVTQTERGKGIGKKLFERTLQHALQENCTGMMWQALHWNEPALRFYRQYNCRFDNEWINLSLERAEIEAALAGNNGK